MRSGTGPRSPQAASVKACAQQNGRSPKAAAQPGLAPSRTLRHRRHSVSARELILAQQFDLPHPERLNSRPAARLDPAADANPSIFEGLKHNSGRLERGYHALWNSHSKVPCPVPAEIQISRCPGLPNGQNLALDHRKPPDPGQNIARTFRVFYGGRIGPDSPFGAPRPSRPPPAPPHSPCRSRWPRPAPRPAPAAWPAPVCRRHSRNTKAGWRP